eukprot:5510923-Pyramimonas_sp.AAC.1
MHGWGCRVLAPRLYVLNTRNARTVGPCSTVMAAQAGDTRISHGVRSRQNPKGNSAAAALFGVGRKARGSFCPSKR